MAMRNGVRLLMTGVATAGLMALTLPASTHTHLEADGSAITWYPIECCHSGDCRPVASIRPAANGLWMTTVDGATVLVGPRDKLRPSRDLRWHICLGPGDIDGSPRVRCIFTPPNS
jgi:hypothetical protein